MQSLLVHSLVGVMFQSTRQQSCAGLGLIFCLQMTQNPTPNKVRCTYALFLKAHTRILHYFTLLVYALRPRRPVHFSACSDIAVCTDDGIHRVTIRTWSSYPSNICVPLWYWASNVTTTAGARSVGIHALATITYRLSSVYLLRLSRGHNCPDLFTYCDTV